MLFLGLNMIQNIAEAVLCKFKNTGVVEMRRMFFSGKKILTEKAVVFLFLFLTRIVFGEKRQLGRRFGYGGGF